MSSLDSFAGADPVQRRLRRLTTGERVAEAVDFLRRFALETGMEAPRLKQRIAEVRAQLKSSGTYDHTPEELAFGARLAWRNHARCIGRLWWKSLEVVDCRRMRTPSEVAAQVFAHLRDTFDGGRIRSRITIFEPATAGRTPVTIESGQVLQYAGYLSADGLILGDRQNIELTRIAERLGWHPPATRSPFDFLPLIVRDERGRRHLFELPSDIRREVAIRHPEHRDLGTLDLKWYAVPCVSNMVLTIGGIDYPCAPFNGHYMGTEIASRNLVDEGRYDLLADVGRALGLDVSTNADPLWRDRALTELNRAVLTSFAEAGIHIVDHHRASAQFMEFVKLEQREGRPVSADWSWVVPPQASAACPVFHLPMHDRASVPNFYLSRSIDGNALGIDWDNQRLGRWQRRWHRLQRRVWDWRRHREHLLAIR